MKKNNLEKLLVKKAKVDLGYEPRTFNLRLEKDRRAVTKLFASHQLLSVSDDYEEQLRELFGIKHPSWVYAPGFADKFKAFHGGLKKQLSAASVVKNSIQTALAEHGRWIFYPWLGSLVHVLPEADFQLVRTARNRLLITAEEQEKFYNATIGIGGLSIGSSVAAAIVLQGGGRRIRIADMDRLALTNMNRVKAGVENLGVLKVVITARQIYEMNPYARVEIFADGLTPKNISQFFNGLDIMIDELDNLAIKYLIREQARKHRIAVVMAADNGDNSVVDVERYDLNPKTPFFHGRLGRVTYAQLAALDKFGIGKMITKHVGPENVTERMQQSMLAMGKTIVSWPQLGGAALMNGSAVAYCVRKILNGQPVEPNRAPLSLDEKLTPGYNSPVQRKHREKVAAGFRKVFGL